MPSFENKAYSIGLNYEIPIQTVYSQVMCIMYSQWSKTGAKSDHFTETEEIIHLALVN